jgi:hypothetical protein
MLALHFHSGQALYLGKMLIDFIMQGLRGAASGNGEIGTP